MNKNDCFSHQEAENIINRFGVEFYEKALNNVITYVHKWNLTSLQFIPSYSANLVFRCFSESLGNLVLKIGNPASREIFTEFMALCEYNGKSFCKVFEADIEKGIFLEEAIQPGNTLREEVSIDKRLTVFSSLYKGLHITSAKPDSYPTYTGWVCRITEYMSKREDTVELYLHMKRARDIYLELSKKYSQKLLLHGDFHHDNILLDSCGEYKLIDPKGVIGDAVFDIPRFILNEFLFDKEINEKTHKKVDYIIGVLEKELKIPSSVLRQCLYVETAMAVCWQVEDGGGTEKYKELIKTITFAETILNES